MSYFDSQNVTVPKVSNSSLAWSLGNRGQGRITIQFPSDLGWYKDQPSASFQTLQHRKERTGFWHEYIVLNLLDGSICRLERMGDPYARVEALSPQGTIAHDIAQCFRPDQIHTAQLEDSDLVTELTFPRPLDLIDVLRVCRAIQEGEKTCSYTLLSSNCYFFCLALQASLTRLVASWTFPPLSDYYISSLSQSLNALTNTLTPNSRQHLLLRIYSAFSGSARLLDSIIAELTPMIDASLIQNHVNQALESELWYSNLKSTADLALEVMIKKAVVQALLKEEQLHQDIHSSTMSSQTHNICSESCIYCCKKVANYLVSLADKQHEEQVRISLIRKTRADLFLGLKLDQMGFRPPTVSSQPAGYSLSKVQ